MANPAIVVDFLANTAGLKKGLRDAEGATSGFGSKMKSLGKAGLVGGAIAGVAALTETVKIGIGEWQESTKVAAQTAAVIKSTGGEAGVTAKQVDDLATSIMKKSGIDDEAIKSGENLLLTFTNVRNETGKGNDVFNQATSIMADMSTALGQDMKTSAIQLGKALNDPIKGVSALQRVGVSFTASQKDQIKALVASGQTLDAQKLIMKELQKEFAGSAEAAGKTLPGQINIMKQSFNNFAGDLVGKTIPILQDAISWLRDHWPEISAQINQMWAAVKPILINLGALFQQVVKIVQDNWPIIGPIVNTVATVVKNAAVIIGAAIKLITDLLKGDWSDAWKQAQKIVTTALDTIKTVIETEVKTILAIATKLGKAILDGLEAGITGIVSSVETKINNIKAAITDAVSSVFTNAKSVGANIVSGLLAGMGKIVDDVMAKLSGAWSFGKDVLATVFNAGKSIGTSLVDGLKGAFTGLAGVLKALLSAGVNVVLGDINAIINRINDALSFSINTHIPGVGKIKIDAPNIPNIPLLAKGGIVTQPTLAMLGERGPEAVIPLGAGGAPVEVRVFIGETELRGIVRSEVVTENNRTAQTLLAGLV